MDATDESYDLQKCWILPFQYETRNDYLSESQWRGYSSADGDTEEVHKKDFCSQTLTMTILEKHNWRTYFFRGKRMAVIICPECGYKYLVGWIEHTIYQSGHVRPKYSCKTSFCNFKDDLVLDGWKRQPYTVSNILVPAGLNIPIPHGK